MTILYNDRFVDRENIQVDIEDRGYQFGDGIYEVIRVYGGNLFCLEPHLKRFARSAKEIGIDLPYTPERLGERILELVKKNNLTDGTVYLQVSRGSAPRSHPFPANSHPVTIGYTVSAPRPLEALQKGIKTILTEDIRWLRCDIKSLNLLGAVLAKQKAVEAGCQEVIQHRDGMVTEGSATNVFLVKDGTLFTHPADNLILHGITRQVVLELANELGIPVREEAADVDDLFHADEVFVTGTTTEVSPVVAIDGKPVAKGVPGTITRKLQQAFEAYIGLPHQSGTGLS
ncbi:D-amino-acid transaminase [Salinithrix halophila]|uniref:D-alanine aminotransferase n=1 Tax=Salinithrix halophila TaxID=1485204 RepID=A0ABV8JQL0_9BACL